MVTDSMPQMLLIELMMYLNAKTFNNLIIWAEFFNTLDTVRVCVQFQNFYVNEQVQTFIHYSSLNNHIIVTSVHYWH